MIVGEEAWGEGGLSKLNSAENEPFCIEFY